MRRNWIVFLLLLSLGITPIPSFAADHVDGPRASADPAADITDVFAWMSPNASDVYLVMGLVRNATTESRFSDSVQYVFRTTSQASYGASSSRSVDVICQFDAAQTIECWVGNDDYVTGDASSVSGLSSTSGRVKVFAGLRNDAFFFNLAGFRATARAVTAAAGGLTFDAAGCPALDSGTSTALVTQLQRSATGGSAVDGFANFNVLALVLAVDKSLLTSNGPILSVAGATYRR